jgi:Holliday junction DNA helicase RuvA
MFEYIEGKVTVKNPTYIVLDVQGVGYKINISINTFDKIVNQEKAKLLIHQAIREDAHILYGFTSEEERSLFRNMISVSGIGTNTAILVLSSLQTNEVRDAIISGNVALLKSIKGIGPKTAQRMIVELQDNLSKTSEGTIISTFQNTHVEESISALVMLGFKKGEAEKAVNKILRENKGKLSTEEIIKLSLKKL